MPASLRRLLPHAIPGFLILALLLPVAGFRHLWQDEVETAERARSVAEAGLPRFVDAQGRLSVNAAGQELEEGTLHRYTPWGQFYLGAGGLIAAAPFGVNQDAAVRAPFIVCHALSSSLLSFALSAYGGFPAGAAVGVASVYGVQTTRVLHNRTARYHGALDLLTMIGMIGLGLLGRGAPRGRLLAGAAIFLLPHFHSIGGGLMSSLFCLTILIFYRKEWPTAVVSSVSSLIALLALTRPWLQETWNKGGEHHLRSLSFFEIGYSFIFFTLGIGYLYAKGAKRQAVSLLALLGYAVLFVRIGDLHPYSQARYYLSLPIFLLFWFVAVPWPKAVRFPKKAFVYAAFAAALFPEFLGVFPPWHGLRVVAADWGMKARGERQPLRRAFDVIRASADTGAVIADYAPHYVNWYLRGSPVALMPDRAAMTALNAANPLWRVPPGEPRWHLSYPSKFNGPWVCSPDCDYRAEGLTHGSARYELVSGALNKKFEMCVAGRWIADAWNNAPFSEYEQASLAAEGLHRDELVLAVRCPR